MFLFIMLFFLPKIMQKACQNSYSTGCQQVVDRPYKYQCLIIRHSLSNLKRIHVLLYSVAVKQNLFYRTEKRKIGQLFY